MAFARSLARLPHPRLRAALLAWLLSGAAVAAPTPTPPATIGPPPPVSLAQGSTSGVNRDAPDPRDREQPQGVAEEDFGRWEQRASSCQVQISSGESGRRETSECSRVRLEQQGAGQLSIRLLPAGAQAKSDRQQWILAGVLLPGSLPMRCSEIRCQPRWPLAVQISALASVAMDRSDLPRSLPRGRLVRGDCRVDAEALICQATDAQQRWEVRAHW